MFFSVLCKIVLKVRGCARSATERVFPKGAIVQSLSCEAAGRKTSVIGSHDGLGLIVVDGMPWC